MMAHGLLTQWQRESKLPPQVSLPTWLSRPRHRNARCKLLAQGSTSCTPPRRTPSRLPQSSPWCGECVCGLRVYRAVLSLHSCTVPALPEPGL